MMIYMPVLNRPGSYVKSPLGWVTMNDFTTSLILIDSVYLDSGTDYTEFFLYT